MELEKNNVSEDLKKFLVELESISDNMGIYPAAVKGCNDERDYEQRDGFKNGWNACVMDFVLQVNKAVYAAQKAFSKEEQLFSSDSGTFRKQEDDWYVFLNDTWYYACADWELIPKDKYQEVAKLYKEWGWSGVLYWVYLQRGHEPEVKSISDRLNLIRQCKETSKAK